MDIDYVKAWQRHPEQDGHTDICHINQPPVISGPNQICNDATFTVSPGLGNSYWTHNNQLSLVSSSSTINATTHVMTSYATFHNNSATPYQNGYVHYNYAGSEGCPELFKGIGGINCNFSQMAPLFMLFTQNNSGNKGTFQFFVPESLGADETGTTYEWHIAYLLGENVDTQRVHTYGRFVATPDFAISGNSNYMLHWNLKITDAAGNFITRQGSRNSTSVYGRQSNDSTLYYLDAVITDSAAYVQAVYNRVANNFISADADSIAIKTMIEKAITTELAPYIIWPDTSEAMSFNIPNAPAIRIKDDTRIYPNPAREMLYILPGRHFKSKLPVQIRIYDLPGRLQKSTNKLYIAGERLNISLTGLGIGTYMIQLQQGEYKEHYKIIKSGK